MAAMCPTPQLGIGEPSSSDGKVLAKACSQEGVRFLFAGRMSPTALFIFGRAATLEIEQPVVSLTTSIRRRPAPVDAAAGIALSFEVTICDVDDR
jgi:hypothetical protein